jgi:hypothetical protein
MLVYIAMNTKCKNTRHRCYANRKCYKKSSWTRKNLIKRCKVGTRKCRDNKCHKKKTYSVKSRALKSRSRSLKSRSPRMKLLKYQEPLRAITNNMVQKIASNISRVVTSKKTNMKKRPAWR